MAAALHVGLTGVGTGPSLSVAASKGSNGVREERPVAILVFGGAAVASGVVEVSGAVGGSVAGGSLAAVGWSSAIWLLQLR